MLKILLVDDEATERKGVSFLIAKFSLPLEVHEAPNGRAALEYIKTHELDILFTDVKMPFMDGLELAKVVSSMEKDIKIIIFSAYGEFDYAKRALEAKALHYLLKPVEVDEFLAVMEEVIALCKTSQVQKQESLVLRASYEKMKQYDREQLLCQLVTAPEINEQYDELLKSHHICLTNRVLAIVSLETRCNFFDKYADAVKALLQRLLHLSLEFVSLSPGSAYVILCDHSKPDEEELLKALRSLCNQISLRYKADVSVVVGTPFREISQFPEKIQEIELIRSELFRGSQDVLFAEDIQRLHHNTATNSDQILDHIDSAIENKDIGEIKRQLGELTEYLRQQSALSAIYTRYLFWDILNKLCRRFQIQSSDVLLTPGDQILQCESLDEMEKRITVWLDDLNVGTGDASADSSSIIETVLRIIHTEYQSDLCLDYLAQRVFITPAYLSYLFKQYTGENVIKYITAYRMKKAQKLLEAGNIKIVDICRTCGYEDPSYFNRIFKNCFGVTPKQYREAKDGSESH